MKITKNLKHTIIWAALTTTNITITLTTTNNITTTITAILSGISTVFLTAFLYATYKENSHAEDTVSSQQHSTEAKRK